AIGGQLPSSPPQGLTLGSRPLCEFQEHHRYRSIHQKNCSLIMPHSRSLRILRSLLFDGRRWQGIHAARPRSKTGRGVKAFGGNWTGVFISPIFTLANVLPNRRALKERGNTITTTSCR